MVIALTLCASGELQTHVQIQTHSVYTHGAVLHYSCQHRQRQHCHLLKSWKANYVPAHACVCLCVCVRESVCSVILTVR